MLGDAVSSAMQDAGACPESVAAELGVPPLWVGMLADGKLDARVSDICAVDAALSGALLPRVLAGAEGGAEGREAALAPRTAPARECAACGAYVGAGAPSCPGCGLGGYSSKRAASLERAGSAARDAAEGGGLPPGFPDSVRDAANALSGMLRALRRLSFCAKGLPSDSRDFDAYWALCGLAERAESIARDLGPLVAAYWAKQPRSTDENPLFSKE